MYLFHNGTTWIFGPTVDSECPAGQYRIEPSDDHKTVSIHQVARGATFQFNKLIAFYKKANGESYANFSEFKAAYTGFFSTPVGEGTGGGTSGGLTDTQLRAAAVPVSQASQPLPTGAATSVKQSDGSQKTQVVDAAGAQLNVGVCNGCVAAALSDTVDLPNPGYIQPRLLAGNIKVTDVNGNDSTLAFDLKEVSTFRVKRVWVAGTTANMGIVVIY